MTVTNQRLMLATDTTEYSMIAGGLTRMVVGTFRKTRGTTTILYFAKYF